MCTSHPMSSLTMARESYLTEGAYNKLAAEEKLSKKIAPARRCECCTQLTEAQLQSCWLLWQSHLIANQFTQSASQLSGEKGSLSNQEIKSTVAKHLQDWTWNPSKKVDDQTPKTADGVRPTYRVMAGGSDKRAAGKWSSGTLKQSVYEKTNKVIIINDDVVMLFSVKLPREADLDSVLRLMLHAGGWFQTRATSPWNVLVYLRCCHWLPYWTVPLSQPLQKRPGALEPPWPGSSFQWWGRTVLKQGPLEV